jgi:tetratricopeptide (TPR) repeat protein
MRLLALALIGVTTCMSGVAQQSDTTLSAADDAFKAKNWPEAEKLYQQLADKTPDVARYWYRLGTAAMATGHYRAAADAFRHAREKGAPAAQAEYNVACALARLGNKDEAVAALDEAVKLGFAQPGQIESDEDLASIRSAPQFAADVQQARRNQTPCEYTAENRQFDFWVGDWDAYAPGSQTPQGESQIKKELASCVIWENWKSVGLPYSGKSYNIYDATLKQWEQFWVDTAGTVTYFHGGLKDGTMDYYTDPLPQPDGTKIVRHLQFFNLGPDKVRQFCQASKDGGKTWVVQYDFTYIRKKPAAPAAGN